MTVVTKHVAAAVGLATVPAVLTRRLVSKVFAGPNYLDPLMPPPCTAAVVLHDRRGIVRSGTTATLTVGITNLGPEPQTYDVQTNTPAVVVPTPTVVLGPLERASVVLELAVPAGTPFGVLPPIVVTVGGCSTYRFRWLLKAKRFHVHVPHHHLHARHHHHPLEHDPLTSAVLACSCSHHVDIHDRPDPVHHWYDHFTTECGCTPA